MTEKIDLTFTQGGEVIFQTQINSDELKKIPFDWELWQTGDYYCKTSDNKYDVVHILENPMGRGNRFVVFFEHDVRGYNYLSNMMIGADDCSIEGKRLVLIKKGPKTKAVFVDLFLNEENRVVTGGMFNSSASDAAYIARTTDLHILKELGIKHKYLKTVKIEIPCEDV